MCKNNSRLESSNSPVEVSIANIYFSLQAASSGSNWANRAAAVLSLSLKPLWKDFFVFHSFADLRTLYAASYDSDRIVLYNSTTGLSYTLPGKRNEHPGDGMNLTFFKMHLCSSKMQTLLIMSSMFSSAQDTVNPPYTPNTVHPPYTRHSKPTLHTRHREATVHTRHRAPTLHTRHSEWTHPTHETPWTRRTPPPPQPYPPCGNGTLAVLEQLI